MNHAKGEQMQQNFFDFTGKLMDERMVLHAALHLRKLEVAFAKMGHSKALKVVSECLRSSQQRLKARMKKQRKRSFAKEFSKAA